MPAIRLMTSALLLASNVLAQNNAPSPIPTSDTDAPMTSSGPTRMSAKAALKLAKSYTADTFMSEWDWFTAADPTNGYVNYVSKGDAKNLGLADTSTDGSFIMRADAENRAAGRGRNSVRISSKAQFADGVYILDVNHIPVGCGTWPAFWTVVKSGWPKGGEIDIIEGANAYPGLGSSAYSAMEEAGLKNATAGYPVTSNVASLHLKDSCSLDQGAYMTGRIGSTQCSAYENGNTGCGAYMGGQSTYGTTSIGNGVNQVGGGWYAMWRDVENSGGVYFYFWPRNRADSVPVDVRYANATTTSVENWGQPGANLSVPACKGDFGNHVIVFNIAFCGDYAGNTYTQAGCPQTCTSFVQNNPIAFADAFWSINSLRVYTATGKAAAGDGLGAGAIAGIVVGVVGGLVLFALLFWRYRKTKARRKERVGLNSYDADDGAGMPKTQAWAGFDDVVGPSSSRENVAQAEPLGFKLKPKKGNGKTSTRVLKENEDIPGDAYPTRKNKGDQVYIATAKPRTGKTVLRPGMTARNYLDGETPIGSTTPEFDPVADGFVLQSRKGSVASWVG